MTMRGCPVCGDYVEYICKGCGLEVNQCECDKPWKAPEEKAK